MSDLADRQCVPCRGGVPPLSDESARALLSQLDGGEIDRGGHLGRACSCPDFQTPLAVVTPAGAPARAQGHHPDIHLAWGRVRIELWTHKIDGLTESDFILAAKIDRLPR